MSMSRIRRRLRRFAAGGLVASGAVLLLTVSGPAAAGPGLPAPGAGPGAGTTVANNVYIQDNPSDVGDPYPSSLPHWQSPGIKVCPLGTVECATGTDNLAIGGSYSVWITLQNPGPADTGTLELWRTTPGGGSNWMADWFFIGSTGLTVPSGGAHARIDFHNVPPVGHFCLAVRWESPNDPTGPQPVNMETTVRNNNNIAQRNVNSVAVKPGVPEMRPFAIGSNEVVPTRTSLTFTPAGTPFQAAGGQIVVDLGPTLFGRWRQAGGRGVGIQQVGATQLQIVASPARIEELPLNPGERITLTLRFSLAGSGPIGGSFGLNVDQGKPSPAIPCSPAGGPCPPPPNRAPIGGVRYLITIVE
jgi:hypothetical protein